MTTPWLPAELGGPFGRASALALGVTDWRLAQPDLCRPFVGVRSTTGIESVVDQARTYVPRLKVGQAFGGVTALRLWGIPTPYGWTADDPLNLVVGNDAHRPESRGVVARRLIGSRLRVLLLDDLPVLHPLSALCQVAGGWSTEHLLIGVDAVTTRSNWYPGLHPDRPMVDPGELHAALGDWRRTPGIGRLRDAAALSRVGVDSPPETVVRLLMHRAGLPEPEVQVGVRLSSGRTRTPDLLDRPRRIVIEYEGEHHFREADQWSTDVDRRAEFAADGWRVVQVKASHLRPGGRAAFIAGLRATYRQRGWEEGSSTGAAL